MLDQPLPDDRALADDDVDDALGMPASSASSPSRNEESGVSSAGFSTNRVCRTRARARASTRDVEREVPRRDQADDASGSRNVMSTPPATGIVSP